MTFVLHRDQGLPCVAASNIAANVPVKLVTGGSGQMLVIPAATSTDEILGFTHAVATQGDAVAVHGPFAIVKAIAAASLGQGPVGIASTNGALGPISGASGFVKKAVGDSVGPAAPGETFSVYVNSRQLSDGGAI